MLVRSISRGLTNPYLTGDWDRWFVPLFFVKNVDLAARIGRAAAAKNKTSLVTVQLGPRVVICESTFLLASIYAVYAIYQLS